jgi:hypothetical protein
MHFIVPGIDANVPGVHDIAAGMHAKRSGMHGKRPGIDDKRWGMHEKRAGMHEKRAGMHARAPGSALRGRCGAAISGTPSSSPPAGRFFRDRRPNGVIGMPQTPRDRSRGRRPTPSPDFLNFACGDVR